MSTTTTAAPAVETHTVIKSAKYIDFTLTFTGTITVNDKVMKPEQAADYIAKTLALQLNRSLSSIPTVEARKTFSANALENIVETGLFQPVSVAKAALATKVFLALVDSVNCEQAFKDALLKQYPTLEGKKNYLTTTCITELESVQDIIEALGYEKPVDLPATLKLLNPPKPTKV